jgi:phospholipase C
MPAVSFLKAPAWADGHPGYSDPIDEQNFIVNTINQLQNTNVWKETAVIILYDDSDGWYDHQMSPIVTQSDVSDDNLTGIGSCGTPWAKRNFVDHSITDQASVIRFVEDNWGLGRIGGGSHDATSGSLLNMFDFSQDPKYKLFLSPNKGDIVKFVD